MNRFKKAMLAGVVVPVAVIAATSANAQISGMAVSDPTGAILSVKALGTAHDQITVAHKAELDKVGPRVAALQAEMNTLMAPLDTNKDKKVDDAEIQAAAAAKNPILDKVRAAQQTAQSDIAKLNEPAFMAQAWAIQQVAQKYDEAVKAVATAKSINFVLGTDALQFAQPAADITQAVTAQLNMMVPTVTIAPPAADKWQPSQSIIQLTRVYFEALQRDASSTQPAPAAPTKKPQGR